MKKNGFTFIEMMFVVFALGLLVALASRSLLKSRNDQYKKRARAEVELISTAILQMAWDTGKWPNQAVRNNPGSKEIWNLNPNKVGLQGTDGSYENWKGPYFEKEMIDPWGEPYFFDPDYRSNGVMHVVVGSFGPNRVGPNQYDSDDICVLLDD